MYLLIKYEIFQYSVRGILLPPSPLLGPLSPTRFQYLKIDKLEIK